MFASMRSSGRLHASVAVVCLMGTVLTVGGSGGPTLDRNAQRWVERTLKALTLEQKVGQLFVPAFESTFIGTDSSEFARLAELVERYGVGGLHVFGGSQPVPAVLLGEGYGAVTLGDPLEAAATLNRLQARARVPLLNTGDFEAGVGFRMNGATVFPRAMAFGAAGDERLAFEAGRITAVESRALGVHVNFAPVVDVNNNARNPVINTRSFGEDPARVGAMAAAYVRGLQAGGMIATLKHFPGHGDTDVDSHLGLPLIVHPRERLEAVEWLPFRAGFAAGAAAVMVGHVVMPSVDPEPDMPSTLSQPTIAGVLRRDMSFDGLVYTDSMAMKAVADMMTPGEAAVRAVKAGNDIVLHSPDDRAALEAVMSAAASGDIDRAQIDQSVERILRAKARLGLHEARRVDLDSIADVVGTRAHAAIADEVSQRSLTLVKDEHAQVPLKTERDAKVLYLSVLDYPTWSIAAPSRTFLPELKKRWPNTTAVQISDRTTPDELALVRTISRDQQAIVVSLFVRAASASGRMDLAPQVIQLLKDLARNATAQGVPIVAISFGNPYVVGYLQEFPAVLLTYDFYDRAELSAVKAVAGEAPIGGRLPIALPGLYPAGHGLDR